MADKERVMKRLEEHYKAVCDQGYEIVGVFLQGSQNYGLDYDGSDIDTKCIVLPRFEDYVLNKKPVSYTHIMENNEHVDIKDIRCMFECFRKQNSNFLEIMFTDYMIINTKYVWLVKELICNSELIVRYDERKFLNACVGMALEKEKAMCHPYPATKDKIDKYGYDGKQVSHILRMDDMLKKYCDNKSFMESLKPIRKKRILEYKFNEIPLAEAQVEVAETIERMKKMRDEYIEMYNPVQNNEVDNVLKSLLFKVLKQWFKEELT